jgi:hypothetical protein
LNVAGYRARNKPYQEEGEGYDVDVSSTVQL